ncbi:MAG: AmmeMemoRadiSam system protein B [Desulfobacterales bacterium]|nr:AmmeMemoRadiSam system protein B [Desulfobacterales bacterium]
MEEQAQIENPKIRPIEAFPVQQSGQEMIGIKDPTGISPEIVFVSAETLFLMSLMDGTNTLRDLQAAYLRRYGALLYTEKVEELITQLDACHLLENRHFQDYLCQLREAFKQAGTREAAFAGRGYEANPEALKAMIRGYFTEKDGPGLPNESGRKRSIKGIVAPHIDFGRGGQCYAHAYKALGEALRADLYIILGTCHTPMQNPFAFTLKQFETPMGRVKVQEDLVADCAQQLPFDPLLDEFCHRNEHTIEFQVIFLQYILGGSGFTIFPILCNSFHELIQKGISPMQDPLYNEAIALLAERCTQLDRVCLVASADLAHVGPQFGHREAVTPGVLAETKAKDLEMLRHVQNLKGEEFYQYILREKDRRNVCGLPPLYALLRLIDAKKGELLHYQQWHDSQGKGAVTFASMAFS